MAGRLIDIRHTVETPAQVLQIRTASFNDLWALAWLQRRCFSGSQAYGVVTLLSLYLWPRSQLLVAWQGQRIAGSVVGDITSDGSRILNLCVDPDFRRRGIATMLLREIEERLGKDSVTLMVEDKNAGAQDLYRREGYLPVSDLRNYYGRNRHGILMQKRLD